MRDLTELEHRALLNALEWLRGEYDCAYAVERSLKGVEVAALTRAIRKLGGDPYPGPLPVINLSSIAERIEIERNAEQRQRSSSDGEPVGIVRHGEISFDVAFDYADDAEEQLRKRLPNRRIGFAAEKERRGE